MKTTVLITLLATAAIPYFAEAQKGPHEFPKPPNTNPPPPRVWEDPEYQRPPLSSVTQPSQRTQPVYVYEQKPVAGRPLLVTQEEAQTVIDRFRDVYPKLGSPRFLIYVNRELVDEKSGMKLVRRTEQVESTRASGSTNGSNVKSTAENTYRADGKPEPTLADRQTVRDVERLFGRPLRAAGAALADQRVAVQLIADRPLNEFIGSSDSPQARREREALARIADAVIEVLISSKKITVTTVSGNQTITVPDIQATAISLKDSKILGQASSSDVTMRVPPASLRNFDVREIAEATALALMDDMTP